MADTAYSMNQFRYNGGSQCMTQISCEPKYLDWKIDTSTSPYYRDILLKPEQAFDVGSSYYLSFGIPRNLNYDLNFSIKLLKSFEGYIYNSATSQYQFMRYISTKRTNDEGTSNSLVCMYQLRINGEEETEARTAVRYGSGEDANYDFGGEPWNTWADVQKGITPRFFFDISFPVGQPDETGHSIEPGTAKYIYYPGVLYHNVITDQYWMFKGETVKIAERTEDGLIVDPFGEDNILAGQEDIVLNWSWQTESQSDMAYYKIIITPTSTDVQFNYILLQLERISEDVDIVTDQLVGGNPYPAGDPALHPGKGQSVSGRYVNLDQSTGNGDEKVIDTFKLYKLINLNSNSLTTNGNPITRFGIWGHPELMLAVNGEEIHIGSSGYYELNDFEVKSLSVVAEDYKDAFTLDYQYIA